MMQAKKLDTLRLVQVPLDEYFIPEEILNLQTHPVSTTIIFHRIISPHLLARIASTK